jgi:hypothetical protein
MFLAFRCFSVHTPAMGDRVRVVHDDEGRLVAITSPPPDDPDRGRRVAALLDGLHHPGVVELLGLVDHPDGPELHTRWVGSRSLADIGRPLTPERAAGLVLAVAATVADLHRLGVVHGAVEPSHVLLDPFGRPVLCGFGAARRLGDGPPMSDRPRPSTDVAGLGQLLRTLLTAIDPSSTPDRRPRTRRPRHEASQRRALLAVARQATIADPTCRPGVRAFIDGVRAAAPTAALGRPTESTDDERPDASPGRLAHEPGVEDDPTGRRRDGTTGPGPSKVPDPLVILLEETETAPPDRPAVTRVHIDAPRASTPGLDAGPGPGGTPTDPLWREMAKLRPGDDDDRPRGLPLGAIGTVLAIAGLSVSTFLGLSAWWSTPSPAISTAVDAEPRPATTTPTTTSRPTTAAAPNAPPPPPSTTAPPTPTTTPPPTGPVPPAPVVEHNAQRFQVGIAGDLALVGDWSCRGEALPALYRPSTGSVFVFPAWPEPGREADAVASSTVADGVAVTVGPLDADGCPSLVVTRADDSTVTLTRQAWS